eukprot:11566428-Alexandrium_andersonii.AAC.1
MSASLVGSEMCIRDRQKPAQESSLQVRARAKRKEQSADSCDHWSSRAVSYTHLTLPTICSV